MNSSDKLLGALIGNAVTAAGWLQDIENIVSIVCCIAGLLITVVTCVIVPLWKKMQSAKEDGKLTPDELQDIADTLKDGIDQIKKDK